MSLLVSTIALSQVTTFSYTGAVQTYTVPIGVTSIRIEAKGAGGGSGSGGPGGLGACMAGTFTVTPGQVLTVVVGQGGAFYYNAGGGGGGSGVLAAGVPLIVAGAGGGAAVNEVGKNASITTTAVSSSGAGGVAGAGGQKGYISSDCGWSSGGGGLTGNGYGGNGLWDGGALPGTISGPGAGRSWAAGGAGGVNGGCTFTYPNVGGWGCGGGGAGAWGGGGGGGYSGGGGGQYVDIASERGGGGGGSFNSGTDQVNTAGCRSGNGEVLITVLCNAMSVVVSDPTVCAGDLVTLDATSFTGLPVTWTLGVVDGVPFTPVGLGAITYTATTASPTDCPLSTTITVSPNPTVTAAVSDATICLGESVTFTGGGATTYSWTGGVTNGVPFTPLTTGTFTFTVTGTVTATGCDNTASVTITVSPLPVVTATATPTSICLGESVTFTGGGATSYTWTGGVTNGVPYTPLTAGTITRTVTGTSLPSGCQNTASVSVVVNPLPTVTASVSDASICLGESITFTGGGAATYSWTGGVTNGVPFTPLTTGTFTYTVTGTAAGTGCQNTASVTVVVNPLPTVTAAVSDATVCLGESITFTGGGATTYTWSGGVTNGVPFTPLTTGTFTYTVTGTVTATGCQNTASVTITVTALPVVTATATPTSICLGESVTFTGGGATSYTWTGGVTNGVPYTPLTAGTITRTVTGTSLPSGCQNTASVSVVVNPLPTVTASVSDASICLGESITFTGGGAATYSWTGGVTNGVPFTPLTAGTFTYTVTGTAAGTGCQNTASVTVVVNPLPTVTATASTTSICLGESITFTGGGATTYTWTGGVTNGVPFTPVSTGTFTFTVTGTVTATGCQNTASVTVTVNDLPTVVATATPDEICIGESIIFTGSGADTYVWDGGITNGVPFTPLTSGTFTYNVTGSIGVSGCDDAASVTITVNPLPTVTAAVSDASICLGETVTFTGGGAATYSWTGGVTNGVPFTPVSAGTVTYTVTGTAAGTGCQNTASVTLVVNPLPTVTATASTTSICLGESITFTGGGATTYTWTGGVTNGVSFTPASSGTFTYTVTGTVTATGCQNTASVTVTVNDLPTVVATATPDEICIGESIIFTGSGADSYVWDGGITDGVAFTPLTSGTFTYNVTGSIGVSGCEDAASVTITVNDLPIVTAAVSDAEICLGESTTFTGGGADTYVWDLGVIDGTPFTPVAAGTLTYTVTGTNTTTTCENTATVDLLVNPAPTVTAAADFIEICLGESVILTGGGADTYVWDVAGVVDGSPYTPLAAGTVTHTVTGTTTLTGCQSTASIDITTIDLPVVTATATPTEICLGESIIFTGGGADTYVWDLGVVDGVAFTPIASGTFIYTVIGSVGASGCENSATVTVTVSDVPSVTALVSDDEICLGSSATFTGAGADTYTWDLGVVNGVPFTPGAAGTVTYTVTGTNTSSGCENTASVDLTVNPAPTVTASADFMEVCLGDPVTLTGGGASTYVWDGGGIDGVPFTPGSVGSFTFTVTGTSVDGCTDTESITIEVVECETVLSLFTMDPSICIGDCITLTDASLGTIESWEWDFGPDATPTTSTEQNPEVCFNTAGTFNIELTVTNVNGTTSVSNQALTVNELPVIDAQRDTIIDIGGTAELMVVGGSGGSYLWSPAKDIDCPDCDFTLAHPEDSTTYTVVYVDENGCSNSASMFVLVNFIEGVGVPTAFSPNGDGNNDVLYVRGFGIEALNFVIYNRYGEVVFETSDQNIGWDGTFKNQNENPGVFTWTLQYDLIGGKRGSQKGNTTLMR